MSRLDQPIDIASVAFFRIAFGFLMLWHVLQYLLGGRLERQYLQPLILFKFFGFEWVDRFSPTGMRIHFALLALAALLIAFGLFYRFATLYFALGITYVFLLDEADYQNHTYLICLLAILMVFIPSHRAASLDAWRRPAIRSRVVPAWTLWLLRFQLGVPYFFGGLAKLNKDWLFHAQPMQLWLQQGTEGPLGGRFPKGAEAAYFLCWSGALFDLLIVPALLWRRTRWIAVVIVLGFHLLNSQLFSIGVFPWLMIAATTLFFDPDWPRRVGLMRRAEAAAREKLGAKRRKKPRPDVVEAPVTPLGRRGRGVLAAWVALQLLFPLRHFAYPGNVDWTEEGIRFSWRMKLRDKRGSIRFTAFDDQGRRIDLADAKDALSQRQWEMMVHDPDMIRQFAKELAQRLEKAGCADCQVRAETSISFNGRPPRPLVQPEADLAHAPRRLYGAEWIAPLAEED